MAGISKFIAESGMGGLLDIKSASFSATLAQASGGNVTLGVELEFMRKERALEFPFNFRNPVSAVEELVKRLLPNK